MNYVVTNPLLDPSRNSKECCRCCDCFRLISPSCELVTRQLIGKVHGDLFSAYQLISRLPRDDATRMLIGSSSSDMTKRFAVQPMCLTYNLLSTLDDSDEHLSLCSTDVNKIT